MVSGRCGKFHEEKTITGRCLLAVKKLALKMYVPVLDVITDLIHYLVTKGFTANRKR